MGGRNKSCVFIKFKCEDFVAFGKKYEIKKKFQNDLKKEARDDKADVYKSEIERKMRFMVFISSLYGDLAGKKVQNRYARLLN